MHSEREGEEQGDGYIKSVARDGSYKGSGSKGEFKVKIILYFVLFLK